jgi:uncharacterized membrane protein YkoI
MAYSLKVFVVPVVVALLAAGAAAAPLAGQGQQAMYTRNLPAALLKEARVREADAAKTALARVPTAHIQAVELENENGRLIYSYELKVPGRSGVEEVNVNAKTGTVVNTEHESPASEHGEAKQAKVKKDTT